MLRTITPVLSIVLAVLLFLFFVQPEYEEVKTLRKDRDDYRAATQQYADFNAKLEALIQKRESLSISERERLEEFVPSEIDTAELLVKLEKLAKQNNLLFGNISAEGGGKEDLAKQGEDSSSDAGSDAELISSDISFGVIGTYEQFKEFLRDLESSLTLFEVTAIALQGSGETQFQQYGVTVRAFAMSESN